MYEFKVVDIKPSQVATMDEVLNEHGNNGWMAVTVIIAQYQYKVLMQRLKK